ncbi:hypothetical protein KQI63_14460 [bacterium]|nr:hypothetical protein [bacterium]
MSEMEQSRGREVISSEDLNDHAVDVFQIARSWWLLLLSHLRVFFMVGFIAGVVSIAVALLLPQRYEVEAIVLPPQSSSSGATASLLAQFGSISGMGFGSAQLVDLYPAIAKSSSILQTTLKREFDGRNFAQALLELTPSDTVSEQQIGNLIIGLQNTLSPTTSSLTDIFKLRYQHEDPYLASALVNAVLAEIEDFFQNRFKTEARSQRNQIQNRLVQVADSLKTAENKLMEFRQENRSISGSPHLLLQEGRLRREVEIKNSMFLELSKQLEVVKISEIGERPVLNVLDYAEPPDDPSYPPRRTIVLGGTIAPVLLLYMFYLLQMYGYVDRVLGVFVPVRSKEAREE